MKKKLTFTVILLLIAVPAIVFAFDLGSFCNEKEDGTYAHPGSNTMFIQCNSGQAYEENCPDGLVYDEASGFCSFGTPDSGSKISCYWSFDTSGWFVDDYYEVVCNDPKTNTRCVQVKGHDFKTQSKCTPN